MRQRCCVCQVIGGPTGTGLQLGKATFLAAGKGRREMFLLLLFNSFSFLPWPSLSSPLLSLLSFFSLSVGDDTKRPTRVDVSLNPNSVNQSIHMMRPQFTMYLHIVFQNVSLDSFCTVLP